MVGFRAEICLFLASFLSFLRGGAATWIDGGVARRLSNSTAAEKPLWNDLKAQSQSAMLSLGGLGGISDRRVVATYAADSQVATYVTDKDMLDVLSAVVDGVVGIKRNENTRTFVVFCESFEAQELTIDALVNLSWSNTTPILDLKLTQSSAADQDEVLGANGVRRLAASNYIPSEFTGTRYWNLKWDDDLKNGDIDAPDAWDVYNSESTAGGQPVIIAVLDTGVDFRHPDLAGRMWRNPGEIPGDGVDNDGNGFADDVHGIDLVHKDGEPMDDSETGHGTHVAGILAAQANNGQGSVGVTSFSKNILVMAVKFLDKSGEGYLSDAILGLEYAIENGAKISNNSWGAANVAFAAWQLFNKVMQAVAEQDHLFVGAAGNAGKDIDQDSNIPCSFTTPTIMCVSAFEGNEGNPDLPSWANTGVVSVDMFAPGADIYSLQPDDRAETYSGTSMAVPHVSGAAALLKSFRPNLNATELTQLLYNGMEGELNWVEKAVHGGRLNIFNSISSAKTQYQAPVPLSSTVTGIRPYTDTNSYVGQISGSLTGIVSGYSDDMRMAVYFLDRSGEPLEPPVKITSQSWNEAKTELTVELAAQVPVPVGAIELALLPASDAVGIMWTQGATTAFEDQGVPQRAARNIFCNTTDENQKGGAYKSYVRWRSPTTEEDITHYRIYQVTLDGDGKPQKANHRHEMSVPAYGVRQPTCYGGNACGKISIGMTNNNHGDRYDEYKIERRGGYDNGETAYMMLYGPGTLTFEHMETEIGYDRLVYGDRMATGSASVADVRIEGNMAIFWQSDSSTTGEGWTLRFRQDNSYGTWVNIASLVGTHLTVVPTYNEKETQLPAFGTTPSNYVTIHDAGPIQEPTPSGPSAPPAGIIQKVVFLDTDQRAKVVAGQIFVEGSCQEGATHVKAFLVEQDDMDGLSAMRVQSYLKQLGVATPYVGCKASIEIPATHIEYTTGTYTKFAIVLKESNEVGDSMFFYKLRASTLSIDWSFIDVGAEPPTKASFTGDLSKGARKFSGDITVTPPENSFGLTGYRAYWAKAVAGEGAERLGDTPVAEVKMDMVCPPRATNTDNSGVSGQRYNAHAGKLCWNPYSPKCTGNCDGIRIIQQEDVWYITRVDGFGQDNYENSEIADIYFPVDGELEITAMDIESEQDQLTAKWRDDFLDLGTLLVNDIIQVDLGGAWRSVLQWRSDATIAKTGWTLVWRPNGLPTLSIPEDTEAPPNAAGLIVIPIYNDYDDVDESTAGGALALEGVAAAQTYVAATDFVQSTGQCTPTIINCPVPIQWSNFNYTTPGNNDRRAPDATKIGACTKQPSINGADPFFLVEKTTCGASRLFDANRGLIIDNLTLTVLPSDIERLMSVYQMNVNNAAGGFYFVKTETFVAPVLPPTITCVCEAGWEAESVYSVSGVTPAPPPPVQTSKIAKNATANVIASLRIYKDPTFSVLVNPLENLPNSVERYWMEVTTQFLGNKVQMRDCTAARTEAELVNPARALPIMQNFCTTQLFDVQVHPLPYGVTHMARISTDRFAFRDGGSVYIRCRIRACAQLPCGSCGQRRELAEGESEHEVTFRPDNYPELRRLSNTSATHATLGGDDMEGDSVSNYMKVSSQNAKVLVGNSTQVREPWMVESTSKKAMELAPPIEARQVWAATSTGVDARHMGVVTAKFQIMGYTEVWAMQNKAAIEQALHAALELPPSEEVAIQKIRKLTIMKGAIGGVTRRTNSTRRILSEGGEVLGKPTKVEFLGDEKLENFLNARFDKRFFTHEKHSLFAERTCAKKNAVSTQVSSANAWLPRRSLQQQVQRTEERVQIDFLVRVLDMAKIMPVSTKLQLLAAGAPMTTQVFLSQLDEILVKMGESPAKIAFNSVSFQEPRTYATAYAADVIEGKQPWPAATPAPGAATGLVGIPMGVPVAGAGGPISVSVTVGETRTSDETEGSGGGDMTLILVVVGAGTLILVLFAIVIFMFCYTANMAQRNTPLVSPAQVADGKISIKEHGNTVVSMDSHNVNVEDVAKFIKPNDSGYKSKVGPKAGQL